MQQTHAPHSSSLFFPAWTTPATSLPASRCAALVHSSAHHREPRARSGVRTRGRGVLLHGLGPSVVGAAKLRRVSGTDCRRLLLATHVPHRLAARPRHPFSRGLLLISALTTRSSSSRISTICSLSTARNFPGFRAFSRKRSPLSSIWSSDTDSTLHPLGVLHLSRSMPPTDLRTAWSISPALARVGSETRSLPPSSSRRCTSSGAGMFC